MKYEEILSEDDAAPDAYEYFVKEMEQKYNLLISDFNYVESSNDLCIAKETKDGKYRIEYWSDDPQHILYKRIENETL